MSFVDYVLRNFDIIEFYFVQHVEVVLLSVAIAAVIGVGLGVATERIGWLRRTLLAVTGTLLTIPSFALFGLLIPLFDLGLKPTVVALTLYAIFPILRNTVTGLETVDHAAVDAARGMGLAAGQRLRLVRLPLAWPVILNGIRVTTLISISIAVVGAVVQGPGLGILLLNGISRIGAANSFYQVLAGTLLCLVVAAVFEIFFAIVQRLTIPRGIRV